MESVRKDKYETMSEVNAKMVKQALAIGITAKAIIENCKGLQRSHNLISRECPDNPDLNVNCLNCPCVGQATEAIVCVLISQGLSLNTNLTPSQPTVSA